MTRDGCRDLITATDEWIKKAELLYHHGLPQVEIETNLRGVAAGKVVIQSERPLRIRYNPTLFHKNRAEFLQQTVPHEVAHLLVWSLYGHRARPHGREWQEVMIRFGLVPHRCHSFDTSVIPQRQYRRFTYHCRCQSHEITAIRHNRIRAGQHYICRRCGDPLKPK